MTGRCQEIIIDKSVADAGADSKIADPESCEILEKVCSLARIYAVVFEP